MKTAANCLTTIAFLCFVVFLFPSTVNAQNEYWPKAQAITDSTMDNLNPVIFQVENQDLMFWQRTVDASTTEICMQNIYSIPFPAVEVLLSQPGIRLTNPIIFEAREFSG